ncbi:MAG: AMP-binding protein, partial [Chloroflexi bacterium]|nr:AMP-binding protein [Chloroflexota bacterium]
MPLLETLKSVADRQPEMPAILAVDEPALTYAHLYDHLLKTTSTLNAAGYGRGARAALVMPNGPHMATLFLAAAASMTAAPLNPNYRYDEFEFYLEDLRADVLIIL